MKTVVLVIGANGQLGSVLVKALQDKFGQNQVIASDLFKKDDFDGIFEVIDALNFDRIQDVVQEYRVTQIYHLAAILSAKGEENPLQTWDINTKTMFNVFEVSRLNHIEKVFFPSSIAVFGAGATQDLTPNNAYLDPATVYGISKASGENWGQYYYLRYGLDVRSIRYPGVIGYQSLPGGGTTDYAVDIFHKAVLGEPFNCFLNKNTTLPMIYMDDVIRATLELMDAPKAQIKTRTSYNLAGLSFSPLEITEEILKIYPNFKIKYTPDFRQNIADKWPKSIDDSAARAEWGWQPKFDLPAMTKIMIKALQSYYSKLEV
ncbi:NAD-dependent epimerase/dehydratase family protein [Formosa sediminum]|uniref:NAD-dependent epimerase/dehydratase family protein n=1 Tax=Formosa sediminum TaxID=2594004 RepID=A0A516GUK1_9FLAO|nr:NAD-dependent epimerase/dehydratase family protein [Formosa sediminum]QDO95202.1 NAD-dependent epimerase/dehydratase family protein [Formosa sediminum]